MHQTSNPCQRLGAEPFEQASLSSSKGLLCLDFLAKRTDLESFLTQRQSSIAGRETSD